MARLTHDEYGAPRIWIGLVFYAVAAAVGIYPALLLAPDVATFLSPPRLPVDTSLYGLGWTFGGGALAVLAVAACIATAVWCRGEPGSWRVHLAGLALLLAVTAAVVAIVGSGLLYRR